MIRYTVGLVARHSAHPLLFGLLLLAAIFLAGGVALELFFARELAAGFFLVYGVMAAVLGGVGYGIVFAVRLGSRLQRQFDIA